MKVPPKSLVDRCTWRTTVCVCGSLNDETRKTFRRSPLKRVSKPLFKSNLTKGTFIQTSTGYLSYVYMGPENKVTFSGLKDHYPPIKIYHLVRKFPVIAQTGFVIQPGLVIRRIDTGCDIIR